MLGMKTYPAAYIKACETRVAADVAAFAALPAKARSAELEAAFFNAQVQLLDYMFVHRLVGAEGKDGNPLNETRLLSHSILLNGGILQIEKRPDWPNSAPTGIKYDPARAVLGIRQGEPIRVTQAGFEKLAAAFFKELRVRYG